MSSAVRRREAPAPDRDVMQYARWHGMRMCRSTNMTATIQFIETENTPAGFRSFTRGTFRSLASATTAATKRVKAGAGGVIVIHVPADRLYVESWVVGHVPTA